MSSDGTARLIRETLDATAGPTASTPSGFRGGSDASPMAPHADCGAVRDGVFAEQVIGLFGRARPARRDGPWLAVASFVNPHDIAFSGFGWEQFCQLPSARRLGARRRRGALAVRLVRRPARRARSQFEGVWPADALRAAADLAYRRLYYYLHKLVDGAIGRILESPSTRRAWPTTPWSCSPPTTATSSAPTAASCRSGTTPSTRPSGCPCWSRARDRARTAGRHGAHQPRGPRPHPARPGRHRRRAGRMAGWPRITSRPSPLPGRDLSRASVDPRAQCRQRRGPRLLHDRGRDHPRFRASAIF